MKKFLIAILFLIPVLVVLAIDWTGEAITALGSVPNPERIEIKNADGELLHNRNVIFNRYDSDGNDGEFTIYISVFPSISDNAINWNLVEGESYDGKCSLIHIDGAKYALKAEKNGSVLMKIYPIANLNAAQSLNIYITSDSIASLNIYDEKGSVYKNEDKLYLDSGVTGMKLYAVAYPAEAMGDNYIEWSSYDSNIISVDKNGYIKVKKEGRTNIYAEVTGKDGVRKKTYVQVVTSAENEVWLLKETSVCRSKKYFTELSKSERIAWVMDELTVKHGELSEISEAIDGDKYIYKMGEKSITVNAIEDERAIEFASNYITDVYIENGGYHLGVTYSDYEKRDEALTNVEYRVSEPEVLTVRDGRIVPKTEGTCTITAIHRYTLLGEEKEASTEITLNVRKRITAFDLILNSADNQRGIMQHRVWGINSYVAEHQIVNTFQMSYKIESVYPDTKNELQLRWETNSVDYATVTNHGEITFLPDALGKDVTVTASLLVHNIPSGLSRSYTFSILKEPDAMNIYSEEEFFYSQSEEGGRRPVALQNSFICERKGSQLSNHRMDYFCNSIYGNGYMIEYSFPDGKNTNDILNLTPDSMNKDITSFTIENLYMRSGKDYEDGANKGTLLTVVGVPKGVNATVRHNVFLYSDSGMCFNNNSNEILIEGNIIGETSLSCIIVLSDFEEEGCTERAKYTFKNNVFRKSRNCSVTMTPGSSSVNPERSLSYIPNIVFEGFIDSYNWKKTEDLGILFSSINEGSLGGFAESKDAIINVLGKFMSGMYRQPGYRDSVYKCPDENGVMSEYVSTSLLTLGLYARVNPERIDVSKADNVELMEFVMPNLSLFHGIIGDMDLSGSCYLLDYKLEVEVTTPDGTTVYEPRIKPNDPCPENEELFSRLMGRTE